MIPYRGGGLIQGKAVLMYVRVCAEHVRVHVRDRGSYQYFVLGLITGPRSYVRISLNQARISLN